MKMRNTGIIILCLFIGFGVVSQAKVTDGQYLYVSKKTIADYKAMTSAEIEAKKDLEQLIEKAEEDLALYQNNSKKKIRSALAADLEKSKIAAGTSAISGEGITITIDDGNRKLRKGESVNDLIVHESDILTVINELNAAGAEAISINGQRYTALTSIMCGGYTVRINGRTYGRPFIIKAIGDNTKMTDRLIGASGYGKRLRDWGLRFDIQSGEQIVIPACNGDTSPKYMKEAKGE